MTRRAEALFTVAVVLVAVADALTTSAGLAAGHGEAVPGTRWLLDTIGRTGALTVGVWLKLGLVAVLALSPRLARWPTARLCAIAGPVGVVALTAAVVAHNVTVIY